MPPHPPASRSTRSASSMGCHSDNSAQCRPRRRGSSGTPVCRAHTRCVCGSHPPTSQSAAERAAKESTGRHHVWYALPILASRLGDIALAGPVPSRPHLGITSPVTLLLRFTGIAGATRRGTVPSLSGGGVSILTLHWDMGSAATARSGRIWSTRALRPTTTTASTITAAMPVARLMCSPSSNADQPRVSTG